MKFIFGTKKFNDRVNRNVFWKCGAITYGIKTRTWGGNFKYFVQMGNRRNTLFWGSKFCNIYTGFEKPPRCFTYYAMLWNMVYLLYWFVTIIVLPLSTIWYITMGAFTSPSREYWTWWTSAIIWLFLGLLGIYYLVFEFKL